MPGLGGDQEVGIPIAAVESGRAREQIPRGQVMVDGGTQDNIRRGGERGEHWVLRSGWPASQVSVRRPLEPTPLS